MRYPEISRTRVRGFWSAFQFKISFRGMLVGLASFLATPLLAVEMPSIRLDTVFPPGGKAGTEVEVTITGGDLEELDGIAFSQPGITAKLKADKTFTVNIAADVPPGTYDARVSGLSGVSNPRAFVVGNVSEAKKTKPNNKPEDALDLPLDSVISGQRAGRRKMTTSSSPPKKESVSLSSARRRRSIHACARCSPCSMRHGRELQVSRRDGLLDFTSAIEGSYLIKLSDLTFAGDAEHFYRLSITHGPHIDFVAPSSVPPGPKSQIQSFTAEICPAGHAGQLQDSDGKTLECVEMEADAAGFLRDREAIHRPARSRRGGRLLASVQHLRNHIKACVYRPVEYCRRSPRQQRNRTASEAQKVALPCEIDGDFSCGNETHWFTFDARKGDVWWIEVLSHRLGMRTNPTILVKRGDEDLAAVMGTDAGAGPKRFNTGSNDPAWRFEAKEDGAYRVGVADLFGGAAPAANSFYDPRKAFRLSIHKEKPDFRLAAFFEPPPEKADDRIAVPNAALVRAGGVAAIRVVAFRRDNFSGDIELSAEGLPAGVSCVPTKILSGEK